MITTRNSPDDVNEDEIFTEAQRWKDVECMSESMDNSKSLQGNPQNKTNLLYEFAVQFDSMKDVERTESFLLEYHPFISKVQCKLQDQQCLISTELPPSDITLKLRSTGLPCVLRGISAISDDVNHFAHAPSSKSTTFTDNTTVKGGFLGAAVCIFEYFPGMKKIGEWAQYDNRGLCRLIQTDESTCLVDMYLNNLTPNENYTLKLHEFGDISQGAISTGNSINDIGEFKSDLKGRGTLVKDLTNLRVYEMIGRSLVVKKVGRETTSFSSNQANRYSDEADDAVCGIVARSAGLFENVKRICSCSGKTLWEELTK